MASAVFFSADSRGALPGFSVSRMPTSFKKSAFAMLDIGCQPFSELFPIQETKRREQDSQSSGHQCSGNHRIQPCGS